MTTRTVSCASDGSRRFLRSRTTRSFGAPVRGETRVRARFGRRRRISRRDRPGLLVRHERRHRNRRDRYAERAAMGGDDRARHRADHAEPVPHAVVRARRRDPRRRWRRPPACSSPTSWHAPVAPSCWRSARTRAACGRTEALTCSAGSKQRARTPRPSTTVADPASAPARLRCNSSVAHRPARSDLRALQERGVELTGRAIGADAACACDSPMTSSRRQLRADARLQRLLCEFDRHAATAGWSHVRERPTRKLGSRLCDCPRLAAPSSISTRRASPPSSGRRVIAATTRGSTCRCSIARGELVQTGGVTAAPGLYVVGLRFQSRRNSNFIDGVGHDARAVVEHLTVRRRDSCPRRRLKRTTMTNSTHDVIIVGARPAGAATAMLLARRGLDVLVVERARITGSDTRFHPRVDACRACCNFSAGVCSMPSSMRGRRRCAVRRSTTRTARWRMSLKPAAGIDALLRTPTNGARPRCSSTPPATPEPRFGSAPTVTRLSCRTADARVAGISGTRSSTDEQFARARAADDRRTTVSIRSWPVRSMLGSNASVATPSACVYVYWPDLDVDGYEWFWRAGTMIGLIPTNENEVCVCIAAPQARLPRDRLRRPCSMPSHRRSRTDRRRRPHRPGCGVSAAHRDTCAGRPARVGHSSGTPGYYKDPLSAHGITDALRDAELLARAVSDGAIAEYQRERDRLSHRPLRDRRRAAPRSIGTPNRSALCCSRSAPR